MQAVILNKIARAKGRSTSALHASIQDDSEMHAKTGSKGKSLHVKEMSMQEPAAAWDIVSGHWPVTMVSTGAIWIVMGGLMRQ